MPSSHDKIRFDLEKHFSQNAFRHGTSAFRFGLIPLGPSDHLPFQATIKRKTQPDLTLTSWNLLADIHLYNNFMNISGMTYLINEIKKYCPDGNVYFKENDNKLFYLFSELAQYLYKQRSNGRLNITKELLMGFMSTKTHGSNLSRSRDSKAAEEKTRLVEKARSDIINIFINNIFNDKITPKCEPDYGHELRLSLKHSLELIHHIESSEGALKWQNRFQLIKQNSSLIKQIVETDFLCLQECSNPDDICQLFQANNKAHRVVSYRVDDKTSDHCVLIYNPNKFDLVEKPITYSLDGKKPCIFAKLKDISTNEVFIVASIHHPGGKHNLLTDIFKQIDALRQPPHQNISFYILGDFNHTQDFFLEHPIDTVQHQMIYPDKGTMAGSDYGHLNQAIDAIITNQNESLVKVSLIDALGVSAPAPRLPFVVAFESQATIAYPRFFQPVDVEQNTKLKEMANELLGVAVAKMSIPIEL